MPGSDTMWYCHQCNAEMRPVVTDPTPLCASCDSEFIEELPEVPAPEDDPRAFASMPRLFGGGGPTPGVAGAIDPIANILGAMFGMRNLGPQTPAPATPREHGSPERPTPGIRREGSGEGSGQSSSGSGLHFSFRSGTEGTSTTFGRFGGSRRQERNERNEGLEPQNLEDFIATLFPNAQPPNAQARPSPFMHGMIMGLLSAGIANPGVGMGARGDGRWGDFALNQEALDRIITQLMEGSNPTPVPAPEDMIASWPRTVLVPGNPLENQDCAICKDSLAYMPPDPDEAASSSKDEPPQPREALTIPCKHSFHEDCIVPWVKIKGTCPVCRFELISQDARNAGNQNDDAGRGNDSRSGAGDTRPDRGPEQRPTQFSRQQQDPERSDSPRPPGAFDLD